MHKELEIDSLKHKEDSTDMKSKGGKKALTNKRMHTDGLK